MNKKINKQLCPENCHYRSKLVPFCCYCMVRILKEREEKNNSNGENESKDLG